MNAPKLMLLAGLMVLFSGCGGGGEVGGTITGLTADGLTLSNGAETISVANGAATFAFPTLVDDGNTFSVVIVTQPSGLQCSVANGSGTAAANVDVSNVAINCVPVWNLSGTVSGLSASGLILSNGTDTVAVAPRAASFAFPTRLATGASYVVTVTQQPQPQNCIITNGDGTVVAAPVTNVAVQCN